MFINELKQHVVITAGRDKIIVGSLLSDLYRMKDFMKTVPKRKTVDVYLRHATPETYRSVLNEIKNMEIYNMLVDTKSEHVNHFLRGVSRTVSLYYDMYRI